MVAARDNRGVAIRLGGAVALFLLLVGQAQVTVLDGSSMLAVAQSIVHHGSLSVPPELGVPGHDGTTYYSKYGLLLPLLSVVPVALAQPIGALTGRVDLVEAAAAASLMPLVGGALAAALFRLGRRLGAPRAAAAARRRRHRARHVPAALRARLLHRAARRARARRHGRARAGRPRASRRRGARVRRPRPPAVRRLRAAAVRLPAAGAAAACAPSPAPSRRSRSPRSSPSPTTCTASTTRCEFGYKPPADPGFTTPLLGGRGRAAVLTREVDRALRAGDRARPVRTRRPVAPRPADDRVADRALRGGLRPGGDMVVVAGRLELGPAARHPRRRARCSSRSDHGSAPAARGCAWPARSSRSASSSRSPPCWRRRAGSCSTTRAAPTARRSSASTASSRS